MTAANRFRFRAWDVHENRMEYPVCFYTTGLMFQNWHNHPDRYSAFMQSTGLCDKNGKEIFEGDIIRFADRGDLDQVIFADAALRLKAESDHDGQPIHDLLWWAEHGSVVGNIYQNPDLLKS